MTTYVIGDIHGCWVTLQRLLRKIDWDPQRDRLWLVGDLVNRGPSSLEVLSWAYDNRDRLTVVLGNHDLHLLARAAGASKRPDDTLDSILEAPGRDELLGWLRSRALMHVEGDTVMVHAGVHPAWTLEKALELARGTTQRISAVDGVEALYARRGTHWQADLRGDDRLAAALAVMTRVRVVDAVGRPRLRFTGSPEDAPDGSLPWYESGEVLRSGMRIVFGHWAMLGSSRHGRAICLDSGCHWGGALTAMRLDDERLFSEPVAEGNTET